jgi:ankyrin repeat protein
MSQNTYVHDFIVEILNYPDSEPFLEPLRLLLKKYPEELSKSSCTFLHKVCDIGNLALAKVMIESGANINLRDKNYHDITPLMYACKSGHIEIVKFLLVNGANMDLTDNGEYKQTALDIATKGNKHEVCELLREEKLLREKRLVEKERVLREKELAMLNSPYTFKKVSALRQGDIVMIQDRPCKIISKTTAMD